MRFVFYLQFLYVLNVFVCAQQAEIDLNACGSVLDQENTRYKLTSDVRADQTCFHVTAENVTISLNGHTILFDDAPPFFTDNGNRSTECFRDKHFSMVFFSSCIAIFFRM